MNEPEFAHDTAANEQIDSQLRDLSDLQLAMVGGGTGEPSLH